MSKPPVVLAVAVVVTMVGAATFIMGCMESGTGRIMQEPVPPPEDISVSVGSAEVSGTTSSQWSPSPTGKRSASRMAWPGPSRCG